MPVKLTSDKVLNTIHPSELRPGQLARVIQSVRHDVVGKVCQRVDECLILVGENFKWSTPVNSLGNYIEVEVLKNGETMVVTSNG